MRQRHILRRRGPVHCKLHLCQNPIAIDIQASLQQFSGLNPCKLPILRRRNFLHEPQLRQQRHILRPNARSRRQRRICRYFRGGIWNKCNLRRNPPRPSSIPYPCRRRPGSLARKGKHNWSIRIHPTTRVRNLGGEKRPIGSRYDGDSHHAKRRHYKYREIRFRTAMRQARNIFRQSPVFCFSKPPRPNHGRR